MEKLQKLTDQDENDIHNPSLNEQFLLMDLLMKMLQFNPDLQPSTQKSLHHPLFWTANYGLEFIIGLQRKFDLIETSYLTQFTTECNDILQQIQVKFQSVTLPVITKLKDTLDSDSSKSIIKNHAALPVEFQGYDKDKVSELLKVIRHKVSISSQFRLFIS